MFRTNLKVAVRLTCCGDFNMLHVPSFSFSHKLISVFVLFDLLPFKAKVMYVFFSLFQHKKGSVCSLWIAWIDY